MLLPGPAPGQRAFLYQHIMIEVLLLEPDGQGSYCTCFFQQLYRFLWPEHTLQQISVRGQEVPVASQQALRQYRQQHHLIALAYQSYLQNQLPQ